MSGSGGGGSSSGVVSYPDQMMQTQSEWLYGDNVAAGAAGLPMAAQMDVGHSVSEIMNTALGISGNPYTGKSPYDPDSTISLMIGSLTKTGALIGNWNYKTDWVDMIALVQTYIDAYTDISVSDAVVVNAVVAELIIDDIEIDDIADDAIENLVISDISVSDMSVNDMSVSDISVDDIVVDDMTVDDADAVGDMAVGQITDAEILLDSAAFANSLDDDLTARVLPRYRRGMQDINSVVSSSFAIGESIIEGFRTRDVAKHESGLRVAATMKNADTELAADQTNIGKDVSMSHMNLLKDTDVNKSNLLKAVSISQTNIGKEISVGQTNIGKDVDVGRTNVGKDVEVGKANIGKDVSVDQTNIGKDISVGKINMDKSLRIITENISKNLRVGEANISKDVEVAKLATPIEIANLNKDVSVAGFNINKDLEVGKANAVNLLNTYRTETEAVQRLIDLQIAQFDITIRGGIALADVSRIKIVAKKEQIDGQLEILGADKAWDLGVFQSGANVLSSIAGGTAAGSIGPRKPNMAASVLGGAMSGAAAGSMVNVGWGTAIGAVLGAAIGFLGAS